MVASDYEGLGRGIGRLQAEERLCELKDLFELARTDVQFVDLEERRVVERILDGPHKPTRLTRDVIRGSTDGYNRYVRAHPGECGATPIEEMDVWRFNHVVSNEGVYRAYRGVLLANPHVPWKGIASFHRAPDHSRRAGRRRWTMLGMPIVYNGCNRQVAWSSTVSTAVSSSLVELKLRDRFTYEVDGEPEKMIERNVGGKRFWLTRFGLVTRSMRTNSHLTGDEITPLPWTETKSYAVADSAADKRGHGLFAGIQVVPDARPEYTRNGDLYQRTGIPTVDGTRSSCLPGLKKRMPVLDTREYATNSNSSHASSHHRRKLTGFPREFGDENTMNLRTEHGLGEARRHHGRFDAATMQKLVLENRNTAAGKHLDGMLKDCTDPACHILRRWDRRNDVDSVGASLFDAWYASRQPIGEVAAQLGNKVDDPLGQHQFLMAVEYTDRDCPIVRTLMAPQQPQLFSEKKWLPGLLCG